VTETWSGATARDTARRLLQQPVTDPGAAASVSRQAPVTAARSDNRQSFADHPEVVAARERSARAGGMFELTGMPNPLFLVRRGPNNPVIDGPSGPMTNFSSYNYLGLATHPKVVGAAQDALAQYGASASASRIFSGGIDLYDDLESRLAQIYDVDAAVITTSGYLTNAGVIGFLLGDRDAAVCDALVHASIVSGVQWSGARQMTFRHNDPDSLRNILRMSRDRFQRALVVIEAHYSMDGDIGRLPEIIAVAREFDCAVMVDEAHSLGVLGAHGYGAREHFGLPGDAVDVWMGTLSKALGSCGGFIAGDGDLIDAVRTIAPGVEQFTGGPSPAAAGAAMAALEVLEKEPERVDRLRHNADYFSSALRERNLDLGLSQSTPICPVLVPGEFQVGFASSILLQRGVYVGPVAAPGVQAGQERLRFFLTSEHTEDQLRCTADLVAEVVGLAAQLGGAVTMSSVATLVEELKNPGPGPA
jgi:7-keto-8-aminopelargonate synthetase-like enzyme